MGPRPGREPIHFLIGIPGVPVFPPTLWGANYTLDRRQVTCEVCLRYLAHRTEPVEESDLDQETVANFSALVDRFFGHGREHQ